MYSTTRIREKKEMDILFKTHFTHSLHSRPECQEPCQSDPARFVGIHGEGNELLIPGVARTQGQQILYVSVCTGKRVSMYVYICRCIVQIKKFGNIKRWTCLQMT